MTSERDAFEDWRKEKGVRTACPACNRGMLVYRQTPHLLLDPAGEAAPAAPLRLALMRCDHCAYIMLFDAAAFSS